MKQALMTALAGLSALATSAQAHEGHGLPGASHWHSTDAIGYVVLAAVVAAALWSTRRK